MNLCASLTYRSIVLCAFILLGTTVFSQTAATEKFVINAISIKENKKTNHRIILREISFKEGDTLTVDELKKKCHRSQQNLMNSSLFVSDTVSYSLDTVAKTVQITIAVKERWYVWPSVILQIQDRNFNAWWYQEQRDISRLNYGAGFTMYNLFGLNHTMTFIFRRGYTEQYGAGYRIPYINKKQTIGLVASYYFYRNAQIWYNTQAGELQYYTDRLNYVREEQEAKIGVTHRHKLYLRQSFEVYYKTSSVSDTVTKLNDNYYQKGNNETAINT